jgi:pyrroloquinoline quinone (PQQ) biosynthesis protein C
MKNPSHVTQREGLPGLIGGLLALTSREAQSLAGDYGQRGGLAEQVKRLCQPAYQEGDRAARMELHTTLGQLYELEFSMPAARTAPSGLGEVLYDLRGILEQYMMRFEESFIDGSLVQSAPADPAEYTRWLVQVISKHRAANHPLYTKYLRHQASREQLRYYFIQETTLDPRFDDILALLQVGTTGETKREIAANYWDEMGNGDEKMVHTRLFSQSLKGLEILPEDIREHLSLEALESGNLSACLSLHRSHFALAVGYFGVTEYLAPRRFKDVIAAWERLGLVKGGVDYHELHISVDARHGAGWLKNVVKELVTKDPGMAEDITRGALLRLNSSERYLDALLERFTRENSPAALPLAAGA